MKLAVSITGNSLEAHFDSRFGRAPAFCIVDLKTGDWNVFENPALSASGGAGVQAAQFISNQGVQVVVSGAFGPKAYDTLTAAEIEMRLAPGDGNLTAASILELYKAGELDKVKAATHEGHHGVQR
jgi:predicted Fe-Mo cluster-binding NifX family protein